MDKRILIVDDDEMVRIAVNELLKQEIGSLILKELDFNRDTMVTITEADTSDDLQQAKVKVSIMPFLKAEKILKVLNSQVFNLQKLLNQKLKMKIVPKIRFELDKSEERKTRIEQLLKKIPKNENILFKSQVYENKPFKRKYKHL